MKKLLMGEKITRSKMLMLLAAICFSSILVFVMFFRYNHTLAILLSAFILIVLCLSVPTRILQNYCVIDQESRKVYFYRRSHLLDDLKTIARIIFYNNDKSYALKAVDFRDVLSADLVYIPKRSFVVGYFVPDKLYFTLSMSAEAPFKYSFLNSDEEEIRQIIVILDFLEQNGIEVNDWSHLKETWVKELNI